MLPAHSGTLQVTAGKAMPFAVAVSSRVPLVTMLEPEACTWKSIT